MSRHVPLILLLHLQALRVSLLTASFFEKAKWWHRSGIRVEVNIMLGNTAILHPRYQFKVRLLIFQFEMSGLITKSNPHHHHPRSSCTMGRQAWFESMKDQMWTCSSHVYSLCLCIQNWEFTQFPKCFQIFLWWLPLPIPDAGLLRRVKMQSFGCGLLLLYQRVPQVGWGQEYVSSLWCWENLWWRW